MRAPVVLVAGAGRAVGLGNLARASAIAAAFGERGYPTHLLIRWYGESEIPGEPAFALPPDTRVEHLPHGSSLAEALRPDRLGWNPTLVLTDLPEADALPFAALRAACGSPVICLNAYRGPALGADLSFLRGFCWTEPGSQRDDVRAGVRYEVVREHVRALRPQAPWSRDRMEGVLVVLGASDPDALTLRCAALLAGEVPKVEAVLGPLVAMPIESDVLARLPDNLTVTYHPQDLPERMLKADMVVTLGGQTTYEAMLLGRPVAVLRTHANGRVADFFASHRCVLDLGTLDEAAESIRSALARPLHLHEMVRRNFSLLDGCGAEHTADEVIAAFLTPEESPLS